MNIWRLNIKPESKDIDARKFCLEQNIMGAGWGIESESEKVEWEEYYEKANQFYRVEKGYKGWWRTLNALKNRIKENDLCWTRDLNGIYYLGRVTDNVWRYSNSELNRKADIVNYRNCQWYRVGEVDSVPGTIVNRFIRGGTVEKVNGETIREFSKYLHNIKSGINHYEINKVEADFFSLIHSDDCEDIIGLYLQKLGYHIIPSSCKKGTVNYEFVLKHKEDGHKCVVQVKKGRVDLNLANYENLNSKVYLFTTKGNYLGERTPNVTVIDENDVRAFIKDNFDIMPDKIQTWIRIHDQLKST